MPQVIPWNGASNAKRCSSKRKTVHYSAPMDAMSTKDGRLLIQSSNLEMIAGGRNLFLIPGKRPDDPLIYRPIVDR